MAAPFIFVDELIYSELARSFAAGGEFLVRGEPSGGYGVLYPVLVSPAYVLFDSLPAAYAAVKAINAVLMSLAAVPAYFLARRMLGPGLSLLAALLAVAVPSMVYTGTVMTENAFYPALPHRRAGARRRRSSGRRRRGSCGLLALCLVAFLTRVQAVALAPALVTAPLLLGLFAGRPLRATLATYRVLLGTWSGVARVVALLQLARGHSLAELLGAYSVVGETSYYARKRRALPPLARRGARPLRRRRSARRACGADGRRAPRAARRPGVPGGRALALVLPRARGCRLRLALRRPDPGAEHVPRRAAAADRAARLGRARGGAAACVRRPSPSRVAVVLPALLPFDRFIDTSAISDTLMLLPWWSLQDGTSRSATSGSRCSRSAVALAALFAFVPRRFALVAAARRALLLRGHAASRSRRGRTASSRRARARSSRGSAPSTATGSTAPCRTAPTSPCSGRGVPTASPST